MNRRVGTLESARNKAHRDSVTISAPDLIQSMLDKLGAKLVAYVVNRDVTTMSKWKTSAPDESVLTPLRQCHEIFSLLEHQDADVTIRAWFIGTNPQLDDESPIEAVREGRYREVLAAARAFLGGS